MRSTCLFIMLFLAAEALPVSALQRPEKEFKIFQFPASMIPRIDGDASDWDIVPDEYAIDIYEHQDNYKNRQIDTNDMDLTVMRIIVEGETSGRRLRHQYDLFDLFDCESGIHSMARTTGYTATMALRMVARGLYTEKGISPPEFVGRDAGCVEFMLEGLKERGVVYRHSESEIQ